MKMSGKQKDQTSESNNHLWGARAQDWASIQEGTCRPAFLSVFEHAEIEPGTRFLDAGCGSGMAAQIASERGAHVSGLDASDNMLAIARGRVPHGEFIQGDLECLPFPDDAFDLVTGFNSFQYAGNPDLALSEAQRVARPGAPVVIMTWGEPEGMDAALVVSAIKPLLPQPPPGAPGPFV
jgi:ubiquinone/menaquinone biosynthesis C-methylase UbiE